VGAGEVVRRRHYRAPASVVACAADAGFFTAFFGWSFQRRQLGNGIPRLPAPSAITRFWSFMRHPTSGPTPGPCRSLSPLPGPSSLGKHRERDTAGSVTVGVGNDAGDPGLFAQRISFLLMDTDRVWGHYRFSDLATPLASRSPQSHYSVPIPIEAAELRRLPLQLE
jgi:hypothetical protein